LDFGINVNKKVGGVDLHLGINGTYVKSEVTKRDELFIDAYQNRTGKPVDAIFGLVSSGFFMDQADIDANPKQVLGEVKPGDIKYLDQNGDRIIDERDEVMIGRFIAPFTYAINFSASYKNFDLFLQGTSSVGGNGLKNNDYFWVSGDKKYSEVVRNRWTPDTKLTATFPRLTTQQSANNFRNSNFWLYKTNRFNLSKVQLTYNFQSTVLRKTAFNDLGLYISGANLLTSSKNREILELSLASTPQFRYFNAGIRARF
jgi:hypothetical protein